jgi:hypothetical protein
MKDELMEEKSGNDRKLPKSSCLLGNVGMNAGLVSRFSQVTSFIPVLPYLVRLIQTRNDHCFGFFFTWFIIQTVTEVFVLSALFQFHELMECLTPTECFIRVTELIEGGLRESQEAAFRDFVRCLCHDYSFYKT